MPEAPWGHATTVCAPIESIEDVPRAVVAVLVPLLTRHWSRWATIPDTWLDVARRWIARSGEETVWAATLGCDFELTASGVVDFALRNGGTFLSGHPPAEARAVVVYGSWLVLGGGGTDADLDALAAELRTVIDGLAGELGHAYLSIEPTFASVVTTGALSDEDVHDEQGVYRPRHRVHQVCDEAVLDAYHYQVLGPGHLARLGGTPAGSVALADGRVGLALGSTADWQPGTAGRAEVRRAGRALLAPLILGEMEMKELIDWPTPEELAEMGFRPSADDLG